MGKRFNFTRKNRNSSHQIKRKKIIDSRGFFERIYCRKEFFTLLKNKNIKQINRAYTIKKATLRGMHYQTGGSLEDKIVTCIKGKVFDVIVDIRKNSKNFLKWYGTTLDSQSNFSNFVPYGFAHGYQTLTDECEIIYFHTDYYYKQSSKIISCFDPKIGVQWPLKTRLISIKDKEKTFINNSFEGI